MKAIVKDLGRFKAMDQNGNEYEIHETSLLRPYNYNSPAPREIERQFALTDGTRVQKIDWQIFKLGDALLTRSKH